MIYRYSQASVDIILILIFFYQVSVIFGLERYIQEQIINLPGSNVTNYELILLNYFISNMANQFLSSATAFFSAAGVALIIQKTYNLITSDDSLWKEVVI